MSWVSTGLGVISGVNQIFGGSDPTGRNRTSDQLAQAALAGDKCAYYRLRCLAGYNDEATRSEGIRCGWLSPSDGPCGWANSESRAYAKVKVAEVEARVNVAQLAANVTAGAAAVGTTAAPGPYLSSVSQQVGSSFGIPPIYLLIGIGAVAFILLRKR